MTDSNDLKLTDAVVEAILYNVRLGMSPTSAAVAEGIAKHRFARYVDRAHADIEPYATFMQQVETAKALGERDYLLMVKQHAIEDPKSAQWGAEKLFGVGSTSADKHSKPVEVKIVYPADVDDE